MREARKEIAMELTDLELAYIYDVLARLTAEDADGISNAGGKALRDKLMAKLDEHFNA